MLARDEKPPEYRPRAVLVSDTDGSGVAVIKVRLEARPGDRWQKGPDLALLTSAACSWPSTTAWNGRTTPARWSCR